MSTNWQAKEQDLIEGVRIEHAYDNEDLVKQAFEDIQDIVGQAYVGTMEYGNHEFAAVKRKEYGEKPEYEIAWQTDADVLDAAKLLEDGADTDNVDLFFLSQPYAGRKQFSDLDRKSSLLEFDLGEHQVVDVNAMRMYLDGSSALCWSDDHGENEFYFTGKQFDDRVPEVMAADLGISADEATEVYEELEERLTSHEF